MIPRRRSELIIELVRIQSGRRKMSDWPARITGKFHQSRQRKQRND
jgi:hypothetical protein